MAVTIILPGMLRTLYGLRMARVVLPGAPPTLDAVIEALHARYPGMRDRLCTHTGTLREHIHVFIGERDAGRDPTAICVPDGSEIHIVPSIAGGEPDRPQRG